MKPKNTIKTIKLIFRPAATRLGLYLRRGVTNQLPVSTRSSSHGGAKKNSRVSYRAQLIRSVRGRNSARNTAVQTGSSHYQHR
jgi:hypothetical protein